MMSARKVISSASTASIRPTASIRTSVEATVRNISRNEVIPWLFIPAALAFGVNAVRASGPVPFYVLVERGASLCGALLCFCAFAARGRIVQYVGRADKTLPSALFPALGAVIVVLVLALSVG